MPFYFIIYLFILFFYIFISFIYLHIPGGGMGEERGAHREKNKSAADEDSSSPNSAIFQFLA